MKLKLMRVISAVILIFATAAAASAFTVKVGLARGTTSGKLFGNGIVVKTAKGTSLSVPNGAAVTVKKGNVVIAGKSCSTPLTITAKGGIGWGKRKYRGSLRIIKAGSGFTVINELDLESYVRGVVKLEMSSSWPFESLKAQAVLARTYVTANRGGFAKEGFDVTDTTASQVYGGMTAESPETDRAVAATAGELLMYAGSPASVFFHSDSGGATADAAHVWGSAKPYLVSVSETAPSQSPKAEWRLAMTPSKIAAILTKMGRRIGSLKSLAVTERDSYGRAVTLTAVGTSGRTTFSAHEFRMAAGPNEFRSTNFSLWADGRAPKSAPKPTFQSAPAEPVQQPAVQRPAPAAHHPRADPLIELTKMDVFSKEEIYDMLFHPEKREDYIRIGRERSESSGRVIADTSREPSVPAASEQHQAPSHTPQTASVVMPQMSNGPVSGTVIFLGRGWGHGVGLSQWGAKAMAEQGAGYRQILAHYFPGTTISK